MTPADFERWIAQTRIKPGSPGYIAARLQLVDGLSGAEAGRQTNMTGSGARGKRLIVERAMRRGGGWPDHWEVVTVALPPEQADAVLQMAQDAITALSGSER